jgi:hypothetical protein
MGMSMLLIQSAITVAYYGITICAAALLVHRFLRARSWDREVLYLIVLVPFLLRVLRLK